MRQRRQHSTRASLSNVHVDAICPDEAMLDVLHYSMCDLAFTCAYSGQSNRQNYQSANVVLDRRLQNVPEQLQDKSHESTSQKIDQANSQALVDILEDRQQHHTEHQMLLKEKEQQIGHRRSQTM